MTHCIRCGKDNPAEIHTCSPHKANGFTKEFIEEYCFTGEGADYYESNEVLYNFLKTFDLIKE